MVAPKGAVCLHLQVLNLNLAFICTFFEQLNSKAPAIRSNICYKTFLGFFSKIMLESWGCGLYRSLYRTRKQDSKYIVRQFWGTTILWRASCRQWMVDQYHCEKKASVRCIYLIFLKHINTPFAVHLCNIYIHLHQQLKLYGKYTFISTVLPWTSLTRTNFQ